MKKIGIVTFYHKSINYGGVLQAFALCEFLNSQGFKAEQIPFQFRRPKSSESLMQKLSRKGFGTTLNNISKRFLSVLNRNKINQIKAVKSKAFAPFLDSIPHNNTVFTYNSIDEVCRDYDIFITGSDQVFNDFDRIFFLEFAPDIATKISYAPSNAKGVWNDRQRDKIKHCLSRFSAVSARDNFTKESVENCADVDAKIVVDPTLLLEKSDWDSIKKPIKVNGEYMLCYFLGDNKNSRNAALAYAKAHNLKIINIPMHMGGTYKADKNFGDARYDVSPEQFIWLVENANCIFTDSFHCIVFAHTYKKQYFVFNRSANQEMSSRITNILDLFDAPNRFLNTPEKETLDFIESLGNIEYTKENPRLSELKSFSKEFLLKNVEDAPDGETLKGISGCTGCMACYNVCPKNCISMVPDKNGFLYPEIDRSLCIKCGKCERVCPILNEYEANPVGKAFACINSDEKTRLESSSGGVFTLIAEQTIQNGGVVFGAAFSDDLSVKHIAVDRTEDINKLRGSKYVQSAIGDTYAKCKEYLDSGRLVLFSGTPCQIGGLISYLGKNYDNLITQDIICHGVPSPDLWKRYLDTLNPKPISNDNLSFRNKQTGWADNSVYIPLENGQSVLQKAKDNPFTKAFRNNLSLRSSCYNCHFKHKERQSDITLADFWGIRFIAPEMNDDKGTSLVIANSSKGEKLLRDIDSHTICKEVDFEKAVANNTSMYVSAPRPDLREAFFECVRTQGFVVATKKYLPNKAKAFCNKIIRRIKRFI